MESISSWTSCPRVARPALGLTHTWHDLRVPWNLTRDAAELLNHALDLLATDPVQHTALLTEAAYLAAHPSTADDLLLGWHDDGEADRVGGAFVRAPAHAPLLSEMSVAALDELTAVLPEPEALGVPGDLAGAVVDAWGRAGHVLAPRARITIHRLDAPRPQPAPRAGAARVAGSEDRDLLHRWFDELMAAHPDDPSERTYVVDDPLSFGGIVLWEVDGSPVAMCGSSRTVAGMVRLGPTYAPGERTAYADAAFAAACARAAETADHVLVLTPEADAEATQRLAACGFAPAATRVVLRVDAQ